MIFAGFIRHAFFVQVVVLLKCYINFKHQHCKKRI